MKQQTEIALKEEQRRNIKNETEKFADYHQIMPGTYCEGNHQQLCENQRCKRYGHDVDEFIFKQQESAKHYHTTCHVLDNNTNA